MSSYTKYICEITDKEFSQKSHLDKHLKSEKYKLKEENTRLRLKEKSSKKLLKKYKTDDIEQILKNMIKKVNVQNEDILDSDSEEFGLLISTKESMKEIIHDIHNFLRNNGAGYGMNALKLFTLFYGLAKIENNGHFKSTNLPDSCKFSNIIKELKENLEIGYEYVVKETLKGIYLNEKVKFMLWCIIPDAINGKTLAYLVEKINYLVKKEKELNFQMAGKIYEYFIGRDQTAISELGAYFTDRHITEYIYNDVLQPTLDEDKNVKTMVDMFGGSGGFTLGYLTYLIDKYPDIDWKTQLNNVYHYDMNLDVVKYAMLEFYCLTGYFPSEDNLRTMNSFSENFKATIDTNKTFDYIVTNPPYGGDKIKKSEQELLFELLKSNLEEHFKKNYDVRNMKELSKKTFETEKDKAKLKQYDMLYSKLKNIDTEKRSKTVSLNSSSTRLKHFVEENKLDKNKFKDKESVSFLMLMAMLAKDGVAVGVLKEGVFFDKKYSFLRKFCVDNYNVEMVVSVDANQFENTTTKTSIIKLRNNGKTKNIKFYDLIVEKDDKDELAENEDGTLRVEKIKDRITKVYHKLVSVGKYDDIVKANYSFNGKDYNKIEIVCGKGYELQKIGDLCEFIKKKKRYASYANKKGKYNYYTSGKNILKCDTEDYQTNTIIIGNSGNGCIFYDNSFSTLRTNHLLRNNDNNKLKYIFYILKGLWSLFYERSYQGSTVRNTSDDKIKNFKIPIPKKESKIKSWTEKISKPYDLKYQKEEKLSNLEKEVQDEIKRITEEENCEEKEVKNICKIKDGYNFYSKDFDTRRYLITGENLPIINNNISRNPNYVKINKKYDNYKCKKGDLLIGTTGTCGRIQICKYEDAYHVHNMHKFYNIKLNKVYFYWLLKYYINDEFINNKSNGSVLKHFKIKNVLELKIKIPKDKKLIEALEPKFKKIETVKEDIEKLDIEYKQYIQELADEAIPPELNQDVDFKE